MTGPEYGALMVSIPPGIEDDVFVYCQLREAVADQAASMGGELVEGPPLRTFVPAHVEPGVGMMPDIIRYRFTMVRQ